MVFRQQRQPQQAAIYRFGWVCSFRNHCLFDLFILQAAFKVNIHRTVFSFWIVCAGDRKSKWWTGLNQYQKSCVCVCVRRWWWWWRCFCCWFCYFIPLNIEFPVHCWWSCFGMGCQSFLFFHFAFSKNHTCECRLHSILRRWRRLRLRYGTRISFHIVRSFQIYSISKMKSCFSI